MERWQGSFGTSCKVLECQVPEDLVGRRPEPLFSLTISLQLVGELKEEVLVVDDLELAHVGLGLQVMGGCLHVQAWGGDKRSGQPPSLPSHSMRIPARGARVWICDRCCAGGPPGEAKEREERDKFREIKN